MIPPYGCKSGTMDWRLWNSSARVDKWRAKCGGMDALLMARLRGQEDENRRRKKIYADERLKAEMLHGRNIQTYSHEVNR